MPTARPGTLEEKVSEARRVVDRLVDLCRGFESDEWLPKFVAVQKAFAAERLQRAVFEEAQLTHYEFKQKWVVSRRLERDLERAMGVLHRHLSYPGHSEAAIDFGVLPADVTSLGTIEDDDRRRHEAGLKRLREHQYEL